MAPVVTANVAKVTATSMADPTKSASATVSITAPPIPVAIAISPTSATVASGGTQQFTAQVSNTTNTAVTWSATAGSVSSSGLYTAPMVTANSTATVTATSVADPAKSSSATVSITAPPPPVAVSISPTSATVGSGGTQQFSDRVSNTTNTAVTWSTSAGSISSSGDRLATPVTHFHDREELHEREAGFGDFNVFSEDRRGWQGVGKKMPAMISSAEGA